MPVSAKLFFDKHNYPKSFNDFNVWAENNKIGIWQGDSNSILRCRIEIEKLYYIENNFKLDISVLNVKTHLWIPLSEFSLENILDKFDY